ncbi:SMP-30/gluconolactonase/LRE family protein [Rhodococcus sp. LB1]|uniref:SMP-30/gluconolactonase/LRE family protein n=1 Tax=Rhodococcus sp. LB1 TaxID=1807499 RepID=UPI0022B23D10|nr:SMP-30/gluconolactonase/LRE family protein [Rhodococcus sp. LB1]
MATDGSLTNRNTWAKFGEPTSERDIATVTAMMNVAADGCTLDAEGALWFADFGGGRVVRVQNGRIVDEIQTSTGVFACALGGSDGRTLFLCTAPDFDPQVREVEHAAELLAVRVDVPPSGGHYVGGQRIRLKFRSPLCHV